MGLVHIEQMDDALYPSDWNPDEAYPEYPFHGALSQKNDVYRMVRASLKGLGLDSINYGAPCWNPIGDLVKPGQTILIKPNWVIDVNRAHPGSQSGMECLVTHPSIIRAVCDYCLIALKGKGRIVIGDAPVQDCNLDALFDVMGYPRLLQFYKGLGYQNISFEDFRAYRSHMNRMRVIDGRVSVNEGVEIDLGENSAQRDDLNGHYVQVANYDRRITTAYHSAGRHVYSISKAALDADLVINLPKPKSHRLAGMTGAMKNLIGIACDKETLPHRMSGDSISGGDSYREASWMKRCADWGLNKKTYYEHDGKIIRATLVWLWAGLFCVLSKRFAPDSFLLGSWYGNDTIWRTVVDLVHIMTYADKEGVVTASPCRRFLTVADMVVVGEGNGPLRPDPKKVGAIVTGESLQEVDAVLCKMMGFPLEAIPLMRNVCSGLTSLAYEEPVVALGSVGESAFLSHIDLPASWKITPHPNWIEALADGKSSG
ncbi:DUF362 domain-containing protein [Candidatus Collinsella stercoripullorum]|uniref:DUF362 domain-containing protein n=1 Tax=Candidatus Collinsella stercoripullorum TaxID=2838522 RepID=UPI0022E6FB7C|nr:DUF362 domain-containing protein [Candidatus Collinsella stercoripullorum]